MNLRKYLPLAAVLVVGLLLRLQNINVVFSGGFFPQGFDPYYYMRLVDVISGGGGWVKIDHYVNYPFGYKVGWLPGYAYLLSLPVIIFGHGIGEVIDAFIPVLLSLLATVFVYLIAMQFVEEGRMREHYAAISALFFTTSPIIVYRSVVGFTDHHIWVLTLLLGAVWLALKGGNAKEKVVFSVISGILLTLLAFSWRGAPIYSAILALSLLLYCDPEDVRIRSLIFVIPSVSAVLSASIGVSFLLIAAFLFIGSFAKEKNLTIHYTAAAVAAVLILYIVPAAQFEIIRKGMDYLLSRNVILSTIVEAKSFQIMDMLWITGFIVAMFSFAGFVMQKNDFLRAWFVSTLALTLFQLRFAEVWTIPVSFFSAYGLSVLIEKGIESAESSRSSGSARGAKGKKRSKTGKVTKKGGLSTSDVAAAVFLVAFVSSASIVGAATPHPMTDDWKNTLEWLKTHTEQTSYYLQPEKKPEYSILAWWNYGNWIVYEAKRPVVANNFQVGAKDAARFFLSQNESEAMKIIQKRGVKYVVTTDMEKIEYYFASIMITAGMNPEKLGLNRTFEIYNNSMFYKLHVENAKNLEHFQLEKEFGGVKIFKVV